MSVESGYIYTDECRRLRDIISRSNLRIEQSEKNKQQAESLDSRIEMNNDMADTMIEVMKKIKPWMDDLLEYNAIKKRDALLAINSALEVASLIVPSSMKGIKFKIEGKEAWLENQEGVDADRIEGSGYKGVVSTYLRNVVMRANPNLLQFLVLDEPLSKLSPENSANFSSYIPLLAENMQILWIEQKKEVFANVDDKTIYSVFKDYRGCTLMVREE